MPLALLLLGCSSDTTKAPPPEVKVEPERLEEEDETLPDLPFALPGIRASSTVHLTRKAIIFNSKTIAAIDDGRLEPSAVDRHLIGTLFDAFAEDVERAEQLASRRGIERDPTLVVFADASTRFATLVDVLYTAGRAGFRTYEFVATTGPGTYGAVRVDPPRFEDSNGPAFTVFVLRDGLRVGTSSKRDLIPTLAGKSGVDAYDYGVLADKAAAHAREHGKTTAVVSAEVDVRHDVVVRAMATVAGERCAHEPDACLLPDVVVEAGAG